MSVAELFPKPGHTQLLVDFFKHPKIETASVYPRCVDCPARLYAAENAKLIDDIKSGIDSAEARAWRKFGDNVMSACKSGAPTIDSRKSAWLFGETVLVVKCASSASRHHPSKITRRIISAAPSLEGTETI